jgi:hypothetical protein
VGQGKQGIHLRRRANGRLSLSLDQGHEGHIHEVLQEDSCSSMYKLQLRVLVCMMEIAINPIVRVINIHVQEFIYDTDVVYFSQVKTKPCLP